tara:strand:- start:135 stop:1115 length:981 start_codon:yes stop_codon:yes gene_type:complete
MKKILLNFFILLFIYGCSNQNSKIDVILDTDANNELDDQHAIAYLLFNGDHFNVEGITINRTYNGGDVFEHTKEAMRIVKLCSLENKIPVIVGADQDFIDIKDDIDNSDYDGKAAVDFIIENSKINRSSKLILLPVGKLTNIALAIHKDPSIIPNVKIVWLGSNYPEQGEYNQVNDPEALKYILKSDVEFEIAIVRYGQPSGTDAVIASTEEIANKMPGLGPKISSPIIGRYGGEFSTFGDYSVNLFENYEGGIHKTRPLFDMAAVAVVKNSNWAERNVISAPDLNDGLWTENPKNSRKIVIWENFNKDEIMNDFYNSMEKYVLVK